MRRRKNWVVIQRWSGAGVYSVDVFGPYRKTKAESEGYLRTKEWAYRDDVKVLVQEIQSR